MLQLNYLNVFISQLNMFSIKIVGQKVRFHLYLIQFSTELGVLYISVPSLLSSEYLCFFHPYRRDSCRKSKQANNKDKRNNEENFLVKILKFSQQSMHNAPAF